MTKRISIQTGRGKDSRIAVSALSPKRLTVLHHATGPGTPCRLEVEAGRGVQVHWALKNKLVRFAYGRILITAAGNRLLEAALAQ